MGGGRLCAELDRRGWTVEGCDASAAMVELARGRLPERAERLVRGRIEELPFPDGSFDAAVSLGVIEYSPSVEAALRELARVVKPAGTCVFSFPNFRGLPSVWRRRLLYPAVRAAKRVAPFGRPVPLPPRHVVGEDGVVDAARRARLEPREIVRLGSDGSRTGKVLAVQIVVLTRRTG
jgi:SAM-dependent methyltransferase